MEVRGHDRRQTLGRPGPARQVKLDFDGFGMGRVPGPPQDRQGDGARSGQEKNGPRPSGRGGQGPRQERKERVHEADEVDEHDREKAVEHDHHVEGADPIQPGRRKVLAERPEDPGQRIGHGQGDEHGQKDGSRRRVRRQGLGPPAADVEIDQGEDRYGDGQESEHS